jgi:hypothetical protein
MAIEAVVARSGRFNDLPLIWRQSLRAGVLGNGNRNHENKKKQSHSVPAF